jgi:hypothetical protein
MRALLAALVISYSAGYHVIHTHHPFPAIPYSAGVHHIHSPIHFMEAHGFALPGFRLLATHRPKVVGGYVTAEFVYTTHFGNVSARLFSNSLNTSHVLLTDPDGTPCLLGKLSVHKLPSRGFSLSSHAHVLRPVNMWEMLFVGGRRAAKQCDVLRAINRGYSDFKMDANLKSYVQMVCEHDKSRHLTP